MATTVDTRTHDRVTPTSDRASSLNFEPIVADTLPKLLRRAYQRWPERIYMRHKRFGVWQRYTWAAAYEQIRAFALGLASLGFERGETIAIAGENQPQLFWAEFAALALGGKATCIYADATPDEMQYIVDNSDAVYLVVEGQEQVDKALHVQANLPALRKIIYWDPTGMWDYHQPSLMSFKDIQELGRRLGEAHPGFFDQEIDKGNGTDVAVICYTSGTTGLPKGVLTTYDNFIDISLRQVSGVPMRPFAQYLSYICPAWGTEQYWGIALGVLIPLVVNFPEAPETVQENIREVGAEVLMFGPKQWESLSTLVQARMLDASRWRQLVVNAGLAVGRKVNIGRLEGKAINPVWRVLYPLANLAVLRPIRDRLGLSKCSYVVSGGAAMAPDVFRFFHAIGVKLRNSYGSTDAGSLTMHQGGRFDLETAGTWVKTHPYFGDPLEYKITEEGELLVRGGSPFTGYHKNPKATAEKVRDGWVCTGDAVTITRNGELIFLERISDLRELSTGHRFPPTFIETRVRFSPYIKEVLILGDKDKPFVSALINIDLETCGRWAERRRIVYSTFPELSQNPQIREMVRGEIAKVNCLLPPESRVFRFANLPKELDPDEGEMTRSRKLRRDFLEARFKDIISAVYSGATEHKAEVPVKYRDGRTAVVRTTMAINDVEPRLGGDK